MKKRNLLVLLTAILIASANLNAANYYVATNGNDANNGTALATPFKTVQKAATVAVAGDVVNIREGVYREMVKPTHSGNSTAKIVFQPYNNEVVTISGADLITGWTLHQGSIYKAAMPAGYFTNTHNQSDQIFVDDKMMFLARWPNQATMDPSYPSKSSLSTFISKSTSGLTTSKFTDSTLPQDIDLVGAEIYLQPNFEAWSWTLSGVVTAVTGTEVTMQTPNTNGKDGGAGYDPKSRYYLYNKLNLLDTSGEWFHDGAANLLYLWCPSNVDPNSAKVEAKKREFAFDLTGLSYVEIKNIKVFAATITTDNESGGDNKGYNTSYTVVYPWRKASFTAPASNIKIDGVEAKYLTHYTDVSGHFFLQWGLSSGFVISGTNHEVRNCKIQYSAGNGIAVQGTGHKIINNEITDINYMSTDASGINTVQPGDTYDVEMSYNTIKRTGRSGITPRSMKNKSTANLLARIHHNDVSEFMIQDWDGGGIYSATDNQGFIRVDHNTFHDAVNGFLNSGIYFDFSKNIIIDHNVMWNIDWPLHLQGYANSDTKNNTLCYNNTCVARNAGNKTYGPFGIANSVGTNVGTVLQNNLFVYADGTNTTAPASYNSIQAAGFTSASKVTNFLQENGSPVFVNLTTPDFQLQAGSPCKDAGTIFTELTVDGVLVPAFNDETNGTVDMGAYEYGKPKFATGCNLTADAQAPSAPLNLVALNLLSDNFKLKWEASTDNVGVTAYHIYKAGVYIGYTENLFYNVKGLTASTSYLFTVKAVDYRGNTSVAATLTVNTGTIDTVKPTAPTNITVTDITLTGFKTVWNNATDNNFVAKYEVFLNGTSKGIVMFPDTTLNISALSANTSYELKVKAIDGTGNFTESTPVTVKTGNAALIIGESFDYTAGTLNPDADGTASGYGYPNSNFEITGNGLRGNWGAKSAALAGSLQYTDAQSKALLTSANSLALENGVLSRAIYLYSNLSADPFGSYRTASTDFGVNGTELWFSLLINVSDISKEVRFIFKTLGNKNNFNIGLKNQQWCIIDSTLNQIGGVNATANSTALLLCKVTYGTVGTASRDDKVELWVNPSLEGTLPAANAVYQNMVGNFGRFGTTTSLASTVASICTLDEIRVGLQREDVTPVASLSALPNNEQATAYIYPTIATEKINVVGLNGYTLKVLNLEGKVLKITKIQSPNTVLDVSAFSKGIYILHASGAEGQRFFKVIVR